MGGFIHFYCGYVGYTSVFQLIVVLGLMVDRSEQAHEHIIVCEL